ncbi:hypothetical protein B296_00018636 [Ensete ventricosum]|uniref:Uncharacterized protein n=1 Tax=Ensete ventricosum TaxID=4639 RepID=A0A426YPB4_ENSVE|nr:hypothetical protein B296_00018636 [Ensete ventricosum]
MKAVKVNKGEETEIDAVLVNSINSIYLQPFKALEHAKKQWQDNWQESLVRLQLMRMQTCDDGCWSLLQVAEAVGKKPLVLGCSRKKNCAARMQHCCHDLSMYTNTETDVRNFRQGRLHGGTYTGGRRTDHTHRLT